MLPFSSTTEIMEVQGMDSDGETAPPEADEYVQVQSTTQPDDTSSTLSLEDHNVIVGFPPGTLIELFQNSEDAGGSSCGGTILSSAPSGAVMEPTPNTESVWPISPHPQLALGSALSISTTETEYRNVVIDDITNLVTNDESLSDNGAVNDEDLDSTTTYLSIDPVTLESSDLDIWADDSEQRRLLGRHDRTSFTNVGRRLSSVPEDRSCWYANFDEADWEQFREAADTVLQAMGPSRPKTVLPPQPPSHGVVTDCTRYCAPRHLPDAFICPLCNDAIVGATALNCGCTVCGPCWKLFTQEGNEDIESKHQTSISSCPSCQGSVDKAVHCVALDVAILNAVKNLNCTNTEKKILQDAFYYRLMQWRNELQSGLDKWLRDEACQREKILAQCIQQEEELLWKKSGKVKANAMVPRNTWAIFSEVALFLVAASFGVKLLKRC